MRRLLVLVVLTVVLLLPAQVLFAETIYMKPYEGDWAVGSFGTPPFDIVSLIKESDAIWVGRVNNIRLLHSEKKRPHEYQVALSPLRVLKGKVTGRQTLRWKSWTTGVDIIKEMVLFTKKEGGQTKILRAGTACYNNKHFSLYSEGLPSDLLLDALSELVSRQEGKSPDHKLAERLLKEYETGKARAYLSCVCLAGALGGLKSVELLKKDIAGKIDGQRDFKRFQVSARFIVRLQKGEGVKAVLEALPGKGKRYSRMDESFVFFVSATEAHKDAIDPILAFAEKHPKYIASAMGALGQIGTDRAKEILRKWLIDKKNWERTDIIWMHTESQKLTLPVSAFAARALARCYDRKAIPLLLKLTNEGSPALRKEAANALSQLVIPEDYDMLLSEYDATTIEEELGKTHYSGWKPPGADKRGPVYKGKNFRLLGKVLSAIARPGDKKLKKRCEELLKTIPSMPGKEQWKVAELRDSAEWTQRFLNMPPDGLWTYENYWSVAEKTSFFAMISSSPQDAEKLFRDKMALPFGEETYQWYSSFRRKTAVLQAAFYRQDKVVLPQVEKLLDRAVYDKIRRKAENVPKTSGAHVFNRLIVTTLPARLRAVDALAATALLYVARHNSEKAAAVAKEWKKSKNYGQRFAALYLLYVSEKDADKQKPLLDVIIDMVHAKDFTWEEAGQTWFPEGVSKLVWHLIFLCPPEKNSQLLVRLFSDDVANVPSWALPTVKWNPKEIIPAIMRHLELRHSDSYSREGIPIRQARFRSKGNVEQAAALWFLRRFSGQSFGFDPLGDPSHQQDALKKWKAWYEKNKDKWRS